MEDQHTQKAMTTMPMKWRLPSPPGATHTSCSEQTQRNRTSQYLLEINMAEINWNFLVAVALENLQNTCEELTARTARAPALALPLLLGPSMTCVQLYLSQHSTIISTSSGELTLNLAALVLPVLD